MINVGFENIMLKEILNQRIFSSLESNECWVYSQLLIEKNKYYNHLSFMFMVINLEFR